MSEETLFEKLGVKYIEKDGIFYPLITLGGEKKNIDVGKYGHMWIDYIRTEYPQRYRSLVRFGELHDKAAEVNDVAYELREDIEKEWLSEHKPKQANSFVEMYRLRTQARMIAEEVVLHDVERLKKELLGAVDGDDYLKEQVIELRYQNQILREENRSLKENLEKAYEFMKQFVIGGINLLEKFMEWIGEKVKDVGRER